MFASKAKLTEEEAQKKRQALKNTLVALGAPVAGLVPAIGAAFGSEEFLYQTDRKYPAASTPAGVNQANKVINAHLEATGLNYPYIINTTDNLPANLQEGAYIPKVMSKVLLKAKKIAENRGQDTSGVPNVDPGGTVMTHPQGNTFVLAHELGHRAQDYHPIAGPSQLVSGVLGGSPLTAAAIATVSAKSKTNRGAIAKGLLTSYALNIPRLASEITASKLGGEYLKQSGITDSTGKEQALQAVGYALAPAAIAAMPIALGRVARTVSQKWKDSRKKQQQPDQPQSQEQIVY